MHNECNSQIFWHKITLDTIKFTQSDSFGSWVCIYPTPLLWAECDTKLISF